MYHQVFMLTLVYVVRHFSALSFKSKQQKIKTLAFFNQDRVTRLLKHNFNLF